MIHFVYSVPRGELPFRIQEKIRALVGLTPTHREGVDAQIPWKYPVRAPHSISYNLLHALKEKSEVRFYSMYEKGVIKLGPNDILLGSPVPVGHFSTSPRSNTDDPESIVSRTIRENPQGKKFLILPYANDVGYVGWVKELAQLADGLVLISGTPWTEDLEHTPLGDLRSGRALPVTMRIDSDAYPVVKTSFNPQGKRKYLYIGHNAWYKNVAELERLAELIPRFSGGHIGGGAVRGWKKIADFAEFTPAFMAEIAREYDIFVTTSTADPQATTVLEQMCFGLAVACTRETGYEYDSITRLMPHDTAHNVRELMALQDTPEETLLARARQNREYAVRFHHWNEFSESIIKYIHGR